MGIESWSSVAASNNSTPPNGAPEGMSAAAVNNTMRQNMASVREWYEGNGWTDLGDTPTYVSTTSFTVSDNQTAFYTAGRRLKLTGSSTLYGTITSSSYSAPNTTVNVVLDSGSLSVSLSAVAVNFMETRAHSYGSTLSGNGYTVHLTLDSEGNAIVNPTSGFSAANHWLTVNRQNVSDVSFFRLINNHAPSSGNIKVFSTRGFTSGSNARESSYTVTNEGIVVIGAADFNNAERNVGYFRYTEMGPAIDNAISGGSGSRRYTQLYAANGTVNTSDQKEKTKLKALTAKEKKVAIALGKLSGIYQWLEAVQMKGAEARYHMGVIAQDVIAAFEKEGLNPFTYGVVCKDVLEDGSERLGVRYEQLSQWQAAGFNLRLEALEGSH